MELVELKQDRLLEIKPLWEQLNQLHEECSHNFKTHYARFTFEERMKWIHVKDKFVVVAAQNDEGIVGYSIVSVEKDVGEIDSIYIVPNHRKTGLGTRLIERAEAWLREQRVSRIVISVAEGNEGAFPFYQKLGYLPRLTLLEKV